MEILNRIIQKKISSGRFKFHWKCSKEKLTHLCFADDLFLFSHGDIESILCLLDAMQEFGDITGLKMHPQKCQIFFSGLSEQEKGLILDHVPIQEGQLPIKYLGVPLITKRLSNLDCKILTEKILKRIEGWESKHISYGGRLQLAQSVLFSLQTYWMQIFLLPKQTLYEIEKRIRRFLWAGKSTGRFVAKVAWKEICWPKSSGGLGLIDLHTWNKAAVGKLLWSLAHNNSNSLWVKWMTTENLKGKNVLEVELKGSLAWSWRNILQVRGELTQLVMEPNYTIAKSYVSLRDNREDVEWARLVWKKGIPKHNFISWIILKGKLSTADRVAVWNNSVDLQCNLCQQGEESLEHLFFGCRFTNYIWKVLLSMNGLTRTIEDWRTEVSWMIKTVKSKSFAATLLSLSFKAVLYHIWRERNRRRFTGRSLECSNIIAKIKKDVRGSISSVRGVKHTNCNRFLLELWNLPSVVLEP